MFGYWLTDWVTLSGFGLLILSGIAMFVAFKYMPDGTKGRNDD